MYIICLSLLSNINSSKFASQICKSVRKYNFEVQTAPTFYQSTYGRFYNFENQTRILLLSRVYFYCCYIPTFLYHVFYIVYLKPQKTWQNPTYYTHFETQPQNNCSLIICFIWLLLSPPSNIHFKTYHLQNT